ncbi:hypothetical protein [Asticcacaulis taihuensis]|uniref:hypothetical protein n=1 Tax=Asticcacaulis taihuensis TaxID=260084 RepID=UPI0026ED5AF2|nr:hypothetical protein [Asticcacaulis taihuensis]
MSSSVDTSATTKKDKKSHVKAANSTTADLNKQQAETSVSATATDGMASSAASVPPVTESLPGDQSSSSASTSAAGTVSDEPSAATSDSASTSAEPKPVK